MENVSLELPKHQFPWSGCSREADE